MDDDLVISAAAEKVADIEDVLMNILVRLPPFSLGRITCVSKRRSWSPVLSSLENTDLFLYTSGIMAFILKTTSDIDKLFPPKTPSRYDIDRPSYKIVVFIKKKSQA